MRIRTLLCWSISLLLLIVSSACQAAPEIQLSPTNTFEPPTITPTDDLTYQTTDGIILGANLNCPDRAAFGYINENVPGSGASVGNPINFRWYYFAAGGSAPDWSTACVPTSYTLYLSPGPDFTTSVSYPIPLADPVNMVNLLLYSYSFSEVLQPTCYRWIVVGHANGIDIDQDQLPLFQDEAVWQIVNNQSLMRGQFQTGPLCEPQSIGPPILIYPPNEETLDNDTPNFQWDVPGVTLEAHWLTFSTDPNVANVDFGWVTPSEEFLMYTSHLLPCTIYYWQVHAGIHSLNYHLQVEDWASTSEIRSFIISAPNCPFAIAIPTATLIPTSTPTQTPWPTYTLVPPTNTPKPKNTKVPTTEPITCSNYDDEPSCKEHSDSCNWYRPPTGGPGSCVDN